MAIHPISDNMDDLSQAEKVVAVLIDNQLISGLDAINVLKEIWNNKKEKTIKTPLPDIPVVPHQKNPIEKDPTQPPWSPDTYRPQRIWYETDHTGKKYPELSSQYSVKENSNVTTIATNDNASSITWDEWNRNHLMANDNPLNESRVFNRKS